MMRHSIQAKQMGCKTRNPGTGRQVFPHSELILNHEYCQLCLTHHTQLYQDTNLVPLLLRCHVLIQKLRHPKSHFPANVNNHCLVFYSQFSKLEGDLKWTSEKNIYMKYVFILGTNMVPIDHKAK